MPDLLFSECKVLLCKAKHVALGRNEILYALAPLVSRWCNILFGSDLEIGKDFSSVTALLHYRIVMNTLFLSASSWARWLYPVETHPGGGEKSLSFSTANFLFCMQFSYCSWTGKMLILKRALFDFSGRGGEKTQLVLSSHFGHPCNAIFYRLELTNVLRSHYS